MNEHPRILLVEKNKELSEELRRMLSGAADITIEESVEHAVNRMGFEDFDLVLLDSEQDAPCIMNVLIEFFRARKVDFALFGDKKPRGVNGYLFLPRESSQFAEKVSGMLMHA